MEFCIALIIAFLVITEVPKLMKWWRNRPKPDPPSDDASPAPAAPTKKKKKVSWMWILLYPVVLFILFMGVLYYGSLMKRSGIAIARATPVSKVDLRTLTWAYENEVLPDSRYPGSPPSKRRYRARLLRDDQNVMSFELFSNGGRNIADLIWDKRQYNTGSWHDPGNRAEGYWYLKKIPGPNGIPSYYGWMTDTRWPGAKEIISLTAQ